MQAYIATVWTRLQVYVKLIMGKSVISWVTLYFQSMRLSIQKGGSYGTIAVHETNSQKKRTQLIRDVTLTDSRKRYATEPHLITQPVLKYTAKCRRSLPPLHPSSNWLHRSPDTIWANKIKHRQETTS